MDTLLTIVNGDSIRVFYRANAADDWKAVKYMSKIISGTRKGYIELDTLKLGEYTFGNSTDTSTVGLMKNISNKVDVKVYPNPAKQKFTIEFKGDLKTRHTYTIFDVEGKIIMNGDISAKTTVVDISEFTKGTYFIKIENDNSMVYSQKLLIE
jgi:hypothetical protein